MVKTPKVSVIIAVYNVEPYIEKCARSLFEQTLREIEYIFVNDCSSDGSLAVLRDTIEDYPKREEQVKILNHAKNRGASAARNTGLKHATGEYVINCDSDDWIDTKMYEVMYDKAKSTNSEIVWCNHIREYADGEQKEKQYNCAKEKERCIKAILTKQGLSSYLCDKLVKRKLYIDNNLKYPEGIDIREDFLMAIKLFYYSNKVESCSGFYYHYRILNDSLSRMLNVTVEDFKINLRIEASDLAYQFLSEKKENLYKQEIMKSKLELKRLILHRMKNPDRWLGIYPEANRYILKTDFSFYTKCMLLLAMLEMPFLINGYKFIRRLKLKFST